MEPSSILRQIMALAAALPLFSQPCSAEDLNLSQDAAVEFGALAAKFARLESIHLRAAARMYVMEPDAGGGTVVGGGSFEYWGAGNRFRARCRSSPSVGLAGNIEVAFDGATF